MCIYVRVPKYKKLPKIRDSHMLAIEKRDEIMKDMGEGEC